MMQLFNQVMHPSSLTQYGSGEGLANFCKELSLDGVEMIWGGETVPQGFLESGMVQGYHLIFFSDWLDFWLEDTKRLDEKFGGRAVWQGFFGGDCRTAILEQYAADLERAAALGVRYVVFHISDVSIEETYHYRQHYTHKQVIAAAADCINQLLRGKHYPFDFLLENLWWSGFTMAQSDMTEYMLSLVEYDRKGIMLDTGHLMNTNLNLRTQEEGCAYIEKILQEHGALCSYIKGVHLNQSLSGAFVQAGLKQPMPVLAEDYYQRFSDAYDHLYHIDTHRPFTTPAIVPIIKGLNPAYLVHELAGEGAAKTQALRTQVELLTPGLRPESSSPKSHP